MTSTARARLLAAILALGFATAREADADPFFFPGLGAESVALGGARTADRPGAVAVGYNPAALNTGIQETTLSYWWAKPVLRIERDANPPLDAALRSPPSGSDLTQWHLMKFRRGVADEQERVAEDAALARGIYFALSVPLAPKGATATTTLGIAAFIPQGRLASVDLGAESAPYFIEFQDRNQAAVLSAGVGRDLGKGWSVGAGVVLDLIQAAVNANVNVPLRIALTDVLISDEPLLPSAPIASRLKVEVAPRGRITAGLRWQRDERLAFGAAFRDESLGSVDAEGRVALASGLASPAVLPLTAKLNTHYQPRRVAVGGLWRPTERLRLLGDLTWAQWSRYKPPLAGYSVANLRGFARAALAAGGILDAGLLGSCIGGSEICLPEEAELLARVPDSVAVDYEFSGARDIFIPRIGASWAWSPWVESMMGYYYRPSIEDDSGFRLFRTTTYGGLAGGKIVEREEIEANMMDNAQHGLSLGSTVKVDPVSVSLTALYVHLVEKQVDRTDSEVPYEDVHPAVGRQVVDFGYPGYSYGGYVVGGMLQVALRY